MYVARAEEQLGAKVLTRGYRVFCPVTSVLHTPDPFFIEPHAVYRTTDVV